MEGNYEKHNFLSSMGAASSPESSSTVYAVDPMFYPGV
jgi:hypothetical protein